MRRCRHSRRSSGRYHDGIMTGIDHNVLEQVLAGTAEPLLVVRVDQPDWPVALANPAFANITRDAVVDQPFADVIENLAGRELALEVSESVRSQQETSFPVESNSREYLMVLKPVLLGDEETARYYAAYWRGSTSATGGNGGDMHHALLKAKRRIRDLSRDDPVTGLLNDRAFREVFEHDWAVAAREEPAVGGHVYARRLRRLRRCFRKACRGFVPETRRAGDSSLPAACQRRRGPSARCDLRRAVARIGRGGCA